MGVPMESHSVPGHRSGWGLPSTWLIQYTPPARDIYAVRKNSWKRMLISSQPTSAQEGPQRSSRKVHQINTEGRGRWSRFCRSSESIRRTSRRTDCRHTEAAESRSAQYTGWCCLSPSSCCCSWSLPRTGREEQHTSRCSWCSRSRIYRHGPWW